MNGINSARNPDTASPLFTVQKPNERFDYEILADAKRHAAKGRYEDAMRDYLTSANNNDEEAFVRLGSMLFEHEGDELTLEKLFEVLNKSWLQTREHESSGATAYFLGVMYEKGFGTMMDHCRASVLYEQAGERGIAQGWTNLGLLQLNEYQHAKALNSFKKAHDDGDSNGTLNIGVIYAKGGPGIEKNLALAHEYFEIAGNKQNVLALKNNAQMYKAENNYFQAIELNSKAAELGDANAMFELGTYYERGLPNVQIDNLAALKYFVKAAELGYPEARIKIVAMCLDGRAKMADRKFALDLMEKLLKHGTAEEVAKIRPQFAQDASLYGQALQLGHGVYTDIYQALRYYKKADTLGNSYAAYAIGCIYQSGIDPSKKEADIIECLMRARKEHPDANTRLIKIWNHRALSSMDSEANFRLGECYELGFPGVSKNNMLAFNYYVLANHSDHPEAKKKLLAMCLDGRAEAVDIKQTLTLMEEFIKTGNTEVATQLKSRYAFSASSYAERLQFGRDNSKPDIDQAIYYYKKSDEYGGFFAPYALGCIYHSKTQRPSNEELKVIVEYFLRARERNYQEANKPLMSIWTNQAYAGNTEAQFRLGECYELGLPGAQLNNLMALQCYDSAASKSHPEARKRILAMCLDGRAEQSGIEFALGLMEKRLQNGNMEEIAKLKPRFATLASSYAKKFQFGTDGFTIDISRALQYYEKADEHGDAYAPFAIGHIYEADPSRNVSDARPYFERAHRRGNQLAQGRLESIQNRIAEQTKRAEIEQQSLRKVSNSTLLNLGGGQKVRLTLKKPTAKLARAEKVSDFLEKNTQRSGDKFI